MKTLLPLCLLLVGTQLTGQYLTPHQLEFLQAVQQRYKNENAYSIDIKVNTYDLNAKQIGDTQEYTVLKSESRYLTQTVVLTSLIGTDFQLLVNHYEQVMQLVPLEQEIRMKLLEQQKTIAPLASLLTKVEIDYQETPQTVILQPLTTFYGANVTYYFSKAQHLLQRVEYVYEVSTPEQPHRVIIEYLNYRFAAAVDISPLQLERYVVRKANNWEVATAFANYELIQPHSHEN